MNILRRLAIAAVLLALLAWGGWVYLLGRESVPETSDYRIDRELLRRLAATSAEGDSALPIAVHHEVVALASVPRVAVFAGESFTPHTMVHGVYQVRYGDGSWLLIDAAMGRDAVSGMPGESRFDGEAFARVLRALEGARKVVVTHEHLDHIAGLALVDDPSMLAGRLVMTSAQHANPETAEILPAALLDVVDPVVLDEPRVVAPGVVLVPAPGHTPGSQLVYVLLEDGRELLFVGDVAWHMDAIRELHYRPRLVTDWLLGEDRAAVMAQFRTLNGLLDEPGLQIVVSHDPHQRAVLAQQGMLGDGLELPKPGR